MKRESHVDELIEEVEELIRVINAVYNDAKTNEDIKQLARPKVKSCFEHLRSCLYYIATDLHENLDDDNKPKNVHFPYGKDKSLFFRQMNKNLPNLDKRYSDIIESIQPHASGDKWLIHFCKATNFNKHTELKEQERKNSKESVTRIGHLIEIDESCSIENISININGQSITPGGLNFNGETPTREIRDQFNSDINVEREYRSVSFILKGTDIDLRDLLDKALDQIKGLKCRIYTA